MNVEAPLASPPSSPAPTSGAPPGAPSPPGAPPFHSALAEHLARTANAEGQQQTGSKGTAAQRREREGKGESAGVGSAAASKGSGVTGASPDKDDQNSSGRRG